MIAAARSLNADVTSIMQICKSSRTWEPTIRQNVSLIHANIFAWCLPLATTCCNLVPELFGTFNRTTATGSEVQLSNTFQTIVASFAKNPFVSPAPAWPRYNPNDITLAKLGYDGNVALTNVVQAVSPAQLDMACTAIWNKILLLPPTGAGLVWQMGNSALHDWFINVQWVLIIGYFLVVNGM
jgi:hypothetical protein